MTETTRKNVNETVEEALLACKRIVKEMGSSLGLSDARIERCEPISCLYLDDFAIEGREKKNGSIIWTVTKQIISYNLYHPYEEQYIGEYSSIWAAINAIVTHCAALVCQEIIDTVRIEVANDRIDKQEKEYWG